MLPATAYRIAPVVNVFSTVVMIFALTMAAPLIVAYIDNDAALLMYDEAIVITFASGALMRLTTMHQRRELQPRDGFLLVALVWTVLPASNDGFYPANSNVALSLVAQPGYKFRRWDGDLSGTIPSGVVTMSAPRAVKALLDPVPYIAPAGVMNAAGTTPQSGVAPGGIVSIFGVNLASDTLVAPDGMLPQTLGGLTVRVGDRILPLFFVSPQQINAQLPDDLATGSQVLIVSPSGMADVRAPFTVVRNAPGLFPVAVDGQAMAMAIHEDGSPVTADAPAKSGELLTVYGTGFGPAERPRPRPPPRPNKPPRRSPRSSTRKAPPPNPPSGAPAPNAPAAGPMRRISSYSLRLAGSESTSWAALASLNRSSDWRSPGLASGWNCLASFR